MTDRPAPGPRGPRDFPPHWQADVLASDGGVVHLRPIVPDDADAVLAFHEGLSERTRYLRYFGPQPTLSPRILARTTTVDHYERVALVAWLGHKIIGMGLYESLADDGRPHAAEVAFVIADEHQGRGLGPILLEHLAGAAAECGFHEFEADIMAENRAMITVFRSAGYQVSRSYDGATVHVEFTIDPSDALLAVRNARERASEARSVQNLLTPTSVAVIGASPDPRKVGNAVLAAILRSGFTGPVFPVHPTCRSVRGVRAYPTLGDVPDDVDMAVVAVPAENFDAVLDDCLEKRVKSMVVLTSGFGETGASGMRVERRMAEAVRAHGMRMVGPNALGVINMTDGVRLNATLADVVPPPGNAAFFCQSGSLGIAILAAAARRGIGLSTFISAGNRADVSGNDSLQFWDTDPDTEVILLYLETFGNARKFARLARRVSRQKPIVAVKSGHHESSSGVGDDVFRALFAQSGVIQVETISELFDVASLLSYQPLPAGDRVAIIANSTAVSLLAVDAGRRAGLRVADPTDLGAAAEPADFTAAIRAAMASPDVDAVITVFVPPIALSPTDFADAILAGAAGGTKPIVATFLGAEGVIEELSVFDEAGRRMRGSVPAYPEPGSAALALARAWAYSSWRARPQSPVVRPAGVDVDGARTLVRQWLEEGGGAMTELSDLQSALLLSLYGIHVTPFSEVSDADQAVAAADRYGYPVAVKAMGRDWRHRADRSNVRLDVVDAAGVRLAYEALVKLTGEPVVQVQQMAAKGIDCRVSAHSDTAVGGLMAFGLGGVAGEMLGDRSYQVLPVSDADADALVDASRSARLLKGYRGVGPVDRDALRDLIVRVSTMADDIPEIHALICDPVLSSVDGAAITSTSVTIGQVATALDAGPRRLR